MATSITEVQEFLDEFDLRYRVDPENQAILIRFSVDPEATTFRDRDGDPSIGLVIRVMEDGEFLSIFCPWAWNVRDCPHRAAVFEALATIQGHCKMLRFDHDPNDGEIRPNIELPIEDSGLTSHQFHRLVHGVMHGVQRFDGVIRHAMNTGEVSFASVNFDERGNSPSSAIGRLQRLAAEAGGIEALEQLACGEVAAAEPDGPAAAGGHTEHDAATDAPRPEAAAPRTVILTLWERLFRRRRPSPGPGREAA